MTLKCGLIATYLSWTILLPVYISNSPLTELNEYIHTVDISITRPAHSIHKFPKGSSKWVTRDTGRGKSMRKQKKHMMRHAMSCSLRCRRWGQTHSTRKLFRALLHPHLHPYLPSHHADAVTTWELQIPRKNSFWYWTSSKSTLPKPARYLFIAAVFHSVFVLSVSPWVFFTFFDLPLSRCHSNHLPLFSTPSFFPSRNPPTSSFPYVPWLYEVASWVVHSPLCHTCYQFPPA